MLHLNRLLICCLILLRKYRTCIVCTLKSFQTKPILFILQYNATSAASCTLKLQSKAKPGLVKGILKNSNDDLMKCLCECCHNFLKGNIPFSKKEISTPKKLICDVAKKSISLQQKRKILQKGGFLATLLSAVASAIAGLIG